VIKVDTSQDGSVPASETDGEGLTLAFNKVRLGEQIKAQFERDFEFVTILGGDGGDPRSVDLLIVPTVRLQADAVETTADGWFLSILCFAIGGPLGWIVEDRDYAVQGQFSYFIHLASAARRESTPVDFSQSKGSLKVSEGSLRPAPITFWDRADSGWHYLGGIFVPAFLLASESDSVRAGLPELIGERLALDLSQRVFFDESDKDGWGQAAVKQSAIGMVPNSSNVGPLRRTDAGYELRAAWSYDANEFEILDVEYRVFGVDGTVVRDWTAIPTNEQNNGKGNCEVKHLIPGLKAGDRVQVKVMPQDKRFLQGRSYTFTVRDIDA
jgi:hypothetical protein